jgi:hypothetical protein
VRDTSIESRAEQQLMSLARIGALLFVVLTAGCAGVEPAPASQPPHTGAAPPTGQSVSKAGSPGAKVPAKAPAAPTSSEQSQKKEGAASAPEKQQALPPLDLVSLENRLKETSAIGLFSKIALKNQVDDLLDQFRAYYQGNVKTTLVQLRQRYDVLLLKVLSLLQDDDKSLATAIGASREAIWGVLADRQKFATIQL